MIRTVVMISLRRLLHNHVELLLAFVVPIAFFSIFALIFGKGIGSGATPKIKVVTVHEPNDPRAKSIVEALRDSGTLRLMRNDDATTISRDQAVRLVRSGSVAMAIVVKTDGEEMSAEILADSSDQVAPKIVSALVGRSLAMQLAGAPTQIPGLAMQPETMRPETMRPETMRPMTTQARNSQLAAAKGKIRNSIHNEDPKSNVIRQPTETITPASTRISSARIDQDPSAIADHDSSANADQAMLGQSGKSLPAAQMSGVSDRSKDAVEIVDVIGDGKSNPVVSMYAAGIAVMFLLFGASGGGGALLEERENQTLDRLLSTHMTMDHLLLGKWFYLTVLGIVQVSVMFVWGQYVFGIDLWGHLDGFLMMTIVTAGAAAAFGLFLATLCKTRGQLNGLSVILILSMSALGGSMVPRYVMSQEMREAGLWTFNAWALDGYNKVFWRELPVDSLLPQLTVLVLSGVVFLIAARILAVRWETN